MKNRRIWVGVLPVGLLIVSASAYSETTEMDHGIKYSAVPYAFKTEEWGFGGGASGIITSLGQPQLSMFATGVVTNNGTWLGFIGMNNLMIPGQDQWLIDAHLLNSYLSDSRYYVSGNPNFDHEQAGSNDSSAENYIRTSGRESHYAFRFRYVLPVGSGSDGALASMMHRKGESTAESGQWNPLENGFTTLELEPFIRRQDLGRDTPETDDSEGQGAKGYAGL